MHDRDCDTQYAAGSPRGDYTGFFLLGKLVEFDGTDTIFKNPAQKETEGYVTGRFG